MALEVAAEAVAEAVVAAEDLNLRPDGHAQGHLPRLRRT